MYVYENISNIIILLIMSNNNNNIMAMCKYVK
jgi:hypothetical protein